MRDSERKKLLEKVQNREKGAARWAASFHALKHPDFDCAYPLVRGYVLEKFMLEPQETEEEEILAIADTSLRKVMKLKKEGKLVVDKSATCLGASSLFTKKVLLMKAAQEDFGFSVTPAESAEITTLTLLTQTILDRCTLQGEKKG